MKKRINALGFTAALAVSLVFTSLVPYSNVHASSLYEDCDLNGYDDYTGDPVPWAGFDGTRGDEIPADWDGVSDSYYKTHNAAGKSTATETTATPTAAANATSGGTTTGGTTTETTKASSGSSTSSGNTASGNTASGTSTPSKGTTTTGSSSTGKTDAQSTSGTTASSGNSSSAAASGSTGSKTSDGSKDTSGSGTTTASDGEKETTASEQETSKAGQDETTKAESTSVAIQTTVKGAAIQLAAEDGNTIHVGGSLSITGTGFKKYTDGLDVEIHSQVKTLGKALPGKDGRFVLTAGIPDDLKAGTHEIVILYKGVEIARQTIEVAPKAADSFLEALTVGYSSHNKDLVPGLAILGGLVVLGVGAVVLSRIFSGSKKEKAAVS